MYPLSTTEQEGRILINDIAPDQVFTDGDCKFESIYTPGHISDHMSFLY